MKIKIRLNDADINLLERVSDITGTATGIDEDGWIDVDLILEQLDELEDKYADLYEDYRDLRNQETRDEYFSNLQFDRGFHSKRYE